MTTHIAPASMRDALDHSQREGRALMTRIDGRYAVILPARAPWETLEQETDRLAEVIRILSAVEDSSIV